MRRTYLVTGEDQSISNDNVLPPASGEDDDLGDIVRCKWLAVTTSSLAFTA